MPMPSWSRAPGASGSHPAAIANHHGRPLCSGGAHRLDLVGRRLLGQDGVHLEGGADSGRHTGVVAAEHRHPSHPSIAQRLDGRRGIRPDGIGQP